MPNIIYKADGSMENHTIRELISSHYLDLPANVCLSDHSRRSFPVYAELNRLVYSFSVEALKIRKFSFLGFLALKLLSLH